MIPPLVTLEEHFFSSNADDLKPFYSEQFKNLPKLASQITDLGPLRLESMNEGHVSLQIISHAPGSMSPDQCSAANNQLHAAITSSPEQQERFAGFAVLPVSNPEACPGELERCVKKLNFTGALIDNRAKDNTYYDGKEYLPLFAMAERLDVPIYLHPTWPTDQMNQLLYTGNFPNAATLSLGASGWGWHSDVGLHILRLFAAGLFDLHPKLKIIVGHMGEMLPFMLDRIVQLSPRWGSRERKFKQVYDENIWITTSGVWSVDPMATILRNTRIEHILYSVDYPFAKNEDGLKFMEELGASGLVDEDQLEKIAFRNAELLLRVKARKRFD